MVSNITLQEQFDSYGMQLSDKILNKCVEICDAHGITDPEEFVEQWIAYSISKLNGQEPTIEYLTEMERKELSNKKDKTLLLSKPNEVEILGFPVEVENDEDDIINMYAGVTTPKRKNTASRLLETTHKVFSPNHETSCPSTPINASQTNHESGKAVYTFGNSNFITEFKHKPLNVNVRQIPLNKNKQFLESNSRFLSDKYLDKCIVENHRLNEIGKKICAKHFNKNDMPDLSEYEDLSLHIDIPSQQKIYTIGKITCDSDGHLNQASTLLIGTDDTKIRSIHLNFSKKPTYSIFPGQVVLVGGLNPKADQFYVEEIITDIEHKLPMPSKDLNNPIKICIVAGPYTLKDDLNYDPFKAFVNYCTINKPTCIILIGPFLDQDNVFVNSLLREDYYTYFEKLVNIVMGSIGKDCEVFIISSCKDIWSCVYPTPPYNVIKKFPNLHLLPDPCMLDINGLSIGITSVDVLGHLLGEELISENPGQDKIKRSLNYIFNQESFYPLKPPHFDVILDTDLATNFTALQEIPNIIIVPGKMKYFARDINNCLAINPGHLASSDGGTFASVVVNPVSTGDLQNKKLKEYMACQIIRV